MPRPKNKTDLLALSTANYEKLLEGIDTLSSEKQEKEFPPGTMNRNIGDVLAHLHHWHLMFLKWYDVGMSGGKPSIPAEGYNWRTLPALNASIWEKYRSISLDDVRKRFHKTHIQVMDIVEKHTDDELFERKRYPWTGNNAVAGYLIGVLSSHYDWGFKLIKKATK